MPTASPRRLPPAQKRPLLDSFGRGVQKPAHCLRTPPDISLVLFGHVGVAGQTGPAPYAAARPPPVKRRAVSLQPAVGLVIAARLPVILLPLATRGDWLAGTSACGGRR